jgi:hypothetical protein
MKELAMLASRKRREKEMRNYIREIRNQVRAMQRAKAKSLTAMEEHVLEAFADGQESADFRFDAFSLWGMNVPEDAGREVFHFLKRNNLWIDQWCRGVLSLTKEQALELGRIVEEWNKDWRYADYNAYSVSFSRASGTEHIIDVRSPNGHYSDSWQWSASYA